VSRVSLLGVPLDLGSGRRGTDMGPSAIRYAQLQAELAALGHEVQDLGNVSFPVAERLEEGDPRARYADAIARVAEEVDRLTTAAFRQGTLPVVLGGDHSLSLGSVAAAVRCQPEVGLLWLDAHGDFNTPEVSPSGNVHGMVLACLVGLGPPALVRVGGFGPKLPPGRCALVGVRQLDPGERELLRESGVAVFTMKDVDRYGLAEVVQQALEVVTRGGTCPLHVSLDLDVVDPVHAPGVGTPCPGGLSYREVHLAMELVADCGRLVSMDVVEVNPILDEHNRTARLATELVASALGKRIL
jgi:arginase